MSILEGNHMDNRAALKHFAEEVMELCADTTIHIDRIDILASVSPEGRDEVNARIVRRRAEVLSEWIGREVGTDIECQIISLCIDWQKLTSLVASREDVPYRDEVLAILQNCDENSYLEALEALHDAEPYEWICEELFPELRYAEAHCIFHNITPTITPEPKRAEVAPTIIEEPEVIEEPEIIEEPEVIEAIASTEPKEKRPFYMSLKTNMLYDILAIPNIGAEFYLGKNISIAGNWHFAWWQSERKAYHQMSYGGDLAIRYWLGKEAKNKPLTGHHVGIYGQMITYDFEFGGSGILADEWNWSVGAEYGYSLPITQRLNIDFTIGVGYHWGIFDEYEPIDGHFAWQATKRRQYFGPTKLEVSLVWLIGADNYNKNKGGRR